MASKTPLVSRLIRRIEVKRNTDIDVDIYVNEDTRPLPPSRRPYGPWHFVGLWMVTGSFNVGGWTTGSSLISLGLNVWVSTYNVVIYWAIIPNANSSLTSYVAIHARYHRCTYFRRLRLRCWRTPWCKVAYWISPVDETELGHMGLSVSDGTLDMFLVIATYLPTD